MRITRRTKSITALSLSAALLLGVAASATLGQAAPAPVSSIIIYDAEAKSTAAQAFAAAVEAHTAAVDASREAVADEAAAKVKAEKVVAAQTEAAAQAQAMADLEAQQATEAEYAAQVAAQEALAATAPGPAPVQAAPAPAPGDPNAPVWTAGTGIWAADGASSDGAVWQSAIDARVGWASTKFDNIVLTRSHLNDAGAPMLSVQVGQVINFDGVLYRITGDAYGDMNAVSAWQNVQAHAPGTDILIQTCTDWNEPNPADPQERAIVGTRI